MNKKQNHTLSDLEGFVERVTYLNPDNGFGIAKLKVEGIDQEVPILGTFNELYKGEQLTCHGQWIHDPKYGKQFKVESFSKQVPHTPLGIKKYLASGKIKGIGPKFADRIVDAFGLKTLYVLENQPEKLMHIEGLGKKKLEALVESLKAQKKMQAAFVFLQSYEITPAYAQRIYKRYGDECISKLQEDPYIIAREIKGIGFKLADKMALALKIGKDSFVRIQAGVEYLLEELSSQGHTCYPKEELISEASLLLEVDTSKVDEALLRLIENQRLTLKDKEGIAFVWLKPFYLAEVKIVEELKRLLNHPAALRKVDLEKALFWVQSELKLKFAKAQKEAILAGVDDKFLIITGGPGTGKSTITRAILKITRKLSPAIILAAPTGRAAKRMSEITYFPASTIHSLLKFNPKTGRFFHDEKNPLKANLLILDEASMIDTKLFYYLIRAVPSSCRVLLIGDIDQLPSVGAGNVLRDLIDSKAIVVKTLTYIFRQGKGSKISYNAYLINKGYYPKLEEEEEDDFHFIEAKEPEDVQNHLLDQVIDQLPKKYGFDPIKDIQVLAPMKKGPIGTDRFNQLLQQKLNPNSPFLLWQNKRYQVKDKVMQIRNNYQKEVYNGDLGFIESIDQDSQELWVDYEGKKVPYAFSELDEVQPAYCVSIHKYQGSEAPCIVMPIHTHHFKMLCRNLIYTGITRGKKQVLLVGTKKALAIAVKNNEIMTRHTGLKYFISSQSIG